MPQQPPEPPKHADKPRRGDKLQLHIDRLSVGGRGVGRTGALVVFVADVAPNEDVEVEITLIKKNFAEARLVTILKSSEARVTPPCPVAGICGGCNWQHISYPEQLSQKRSLVRESLRKFSGFDVSLESLVQPTIASPKPLRYRNRVQFHHEGRELGYFRRGSHRLISIDDCPISEEPIAAQIPILKEQFASHPPGRIEVFVTEDERVVTRAAAERTNSTASDQESDELDQGGIGFAFAQVNTQQNRYLIASVVSVFVSRLLDDESPVLYDFYAGGGNFTFPLAKAFPKAALTAVELNRESVERGATRSRDEFASYDIRWHQQDVTAFLKEAEIAPGAGVLIDPPRAGCSPEVVSALSQSALGFLVYVSCHPVTLARDLKTFSEAGFKLVSVQPFDMFPQTDHIETLVVLERA